MCIRDSNDRAVVAAGSLVSGEGFQGRVLAQLCTKLGHCLIEVFVPGHPGDHQMELEMGVADADQVFFKCAVITEGFIHVAQNPVQILQDLQIFRGNAVPGRQVCGTL